MKMRKDTQVDKKEAYDRSLAIKKKLIKNHFIARRKKILC